jgi:hypothetical protein
MIQTYQGYFQEDGCFIPDGVRVRMPAKRRAIVNILEDEVAKIDASTDAHRRQVAAVKKILAEAAALEATDNVMTDADWDELENARSKTNAGMSRVIDI